MVAKPMYLRTRLERDLSLLWNSYVSYLFISRKAEVVVSILGFSLKLPVHKYFNPCES